MVAMALTSKRLEVADFIEANELFHRNGWTDGLPVIPPTEDRVAEFLEHAKRHPSDILGVEPVKGRVVTAEKVGINAVMAGCLPEHFPVVLAAVEAMCEEPFNLHGISVSTDGVAAMLIVSGPKAAELGISSGVNLFGPGNRASASIGRAIRLFQINVTGAVPGQMDKSTLGHAGKFAFCITENLEASPWEPLHVELGFSPEQSTVTVLAAHAPRQVANHRSNDPKGILDSVADTMKSVGSRQGFMALVLGPEHAGHLARAGWSKGQVREYLSQKAVRTAREWLTTGRYDFTALPENMDEVVSVLPDPNRLIILVAGGWAGAYSAVLSAWAGGHFTRQATKVIR
ncbi:MAG: hypothetical protein HY683_08205 [Chloroflexi bacterium]|nr:hypothetical protein [Chloroflexota bacterium]